MGRNVPARGKNSGGVIPGLLPEVIEGCAGSLRHVCGVGFFTARVTPKTAVSFLRAAFLSPSRVRGKSFRGLVSLREMQSIHGLTPEFGGDAEMAASACVLAIC